MQHLISKFGQTRVVRHERGGVVYPTHGVRIKRKLADVLEREHIVLWCLRQPDFGSSCKLHDNFKHEHLLAYADYNTEVITLNAAVLVSMQQSFVDFCILHEIEHIRRGSRHSEEKIDRFALQLGRRLGLNVEAAYKYFSADSLHQQ